jgi:hypothetical protein
MLDAFLGSRVLFRSIHRGSYIGVILIDLGRKLYITNQNIIFLKDQMLQPGEYHLYR